MLDSIHYIAEVACIAPLTEREMLKMQNIPHVLTKKIPTHT